MTPRRWVLVALAGAALVLVAGRALASLYVEHAWFDALGLPGLGRATLAGHLLLRGGTTLLATLFLFANLYVVRRSVVSVVLPRRVGDLEFGEELPGRYLAGAAALIALVVGSFLGVPSGAWPEFAIALDQVRFGERDPYLERDLGFYVAQLPAELILHGWARRVLLVSIALVVALYALTPSIRWRARTLYVSEYVRRHLTVLGGVLLLLFAWSFRLEGFTLLLEGSGIGGAFAAVDLQLRVPGAVVLAATAIATGAIVIWSGIAGHIRLAFLSVTVMLLLSVMLRYVLPAALRPDGDPARIEAPFLETRDNFSRRAFGGDRVAPLRPGLGDSAVHVTASQGIALWDAPALLRAVDGAAAVGWRRAGDQVHAVVAQRGFLAGGEETPWSVVEFPAWASDIAGAPLATGVGVPRSRDVVTPVIEPDSAPGYRVVRDDAAIVRGASPSRVATRIAHAWALQNFRLAMGGESVTDAVIVVRPQLAERIEAVAPFFVQGHDARPAVAGDTLFWLVELYTASATYPLSEPLQLRGAARRYFHPAGHAVVNSATGVVRIAAPGDPEPPVRSWMERFPELFVDAAQLPDGIVSALVPHSEAARARAIAFARHGPTAMDAPAARRHLAVEQGADSSLASGLTPMALTGRAGLSLTIPVVDANDRVAGIVVASGPDAATRWIPADSAGRTWAGVIDALRTADSTAGTRDARAVHGRIRVVPLPGTLAYAQPTYLWPGRGGPTLAGVTILTSSGTSTGRSLDSIGREALPSLPGAIPPAEPRALYLRMRDALRRGDWASFGAAFDSLGRALDTGLRTLPAPPAMDSLRALQP